MRFIYQTYSEVVSRRNEYPHAATDDLGEAAAQALHMLEEATKEGREVKVSIRVHAVEVPVEHPRRDPSPDQLTLFGQEVSSESSEDLEGTPPGT